MCSKELRSAELDGYDRTFVLLACKSAIVMRAKWQGVPSLIRRIPLWHKSPCIRYSNAYSAVQICSWILAKKKNGIILWKIKLDLVSEPSIWYSFISSMPNRPQTCKPQPFCSHNELPLDCDYVKHASRIYKKIWRTSNGKIIALRNSSVKRSFLLLLLHKTPVVITLNFCCYYTKFFGPTLTANVFYTSFGINTCQKIETKSRT